MKFHRHTPQTLDKPAHDTPDTRKMFVELYEHACANYPHNAVPHGRMTFRQKALEFNRPWYQLRFHVIDAFGDNVPPPLQPTMLM